MSIANVAGWVTWAAAGGMLVFLIVTFVVWAGERNWFRKGSGLRDHRKRLKGYREALLRGGRKER